MTTRTYHVIARRFIVDVASSSASGTLLALLFVSPLLHPRCWEHANRSPLHRSKESVPHEDITNKRRDRTYTRVHPFRREVPECVLPWTRIPQRWSNLQLDTSWISEPWSQYPPHTTNYVSRRIPYLRRFKFFDWHKSIALCACK